MEYKKIIQYQSLIAALLILLLFTTPSPPYIIGIILWFIILIICNQITDKILFSFFIASAFLAIFIIFQALSSKGDYRVPRELRNIFVENFDGENEMTIENPKTEPKKDLEKEVKEVVDVDINIDVDKVMENPEKKPEKKISMMDVVDKDEEDVFGKLNVVEFESSDEDSDEDEDEDDMEVGKSKSSSKKAYKAQKQLYDLTLATKKLGDYMDKLSGPLKNGQKIIDSLNKFGLNKFV